MIRMYSGGLPAGYPAETVSRWLRPAFAASLDQENSDGRPHRALLSGPGVGSAGSARRSFGAAMTGAQSRTRSAYLIGARPRAAGMARANLPGGNISWLQSGHAPSAPVSTSSASGTGDGTARRRNVWITRSS